MQGKSSNRPRPIAIVRAWGGEPVKLYVYGVDSERDIVLVGGDSCQRPIGLPRNDVFAFSDESFERLVNAFKAGASDELLSVYAGCIMYQDDEETYVGGKPRRPNMTKGAYAAVGVGVTRRVTN